MVNVPVPEMEVVKLPLLMLRLAVAEDSDDHKVLATPVHAPHTGAAPLISCRQRVPAPPAAVTPRGLVPLPNRMPLVVIVVLPVPPFATATVPVTFAALPLVLAALAGMSAD